MASIYEYLFGGEDDKNLFDNIGEIFTGDNTESFPDSAFADLIESDPDFADFYANVSADPNYGTIDVNPVGYNVADSAFADLIESDSDFADFYANVSADPNYGTIDVNPFITGITGGEGNGGLAELLAKIIGGGSKSKGGSSGIVGLSENMLDNDLIKILLGKKLLDDDREGGSAGYVPIGQEAYGGGGGQPSYQISNLQPALLPGMAYANQPTTFNNTPPGMEAGGLMAIPQGNKGLPNLPQSVRNNMGYMEAGGVASLENMMDGPGDITQAMLEPGEFVMTRKATENLTPEYLYNLMHQAENAGRR